MDLVIADSHYGWKFSRAVELSRVIDKVSENYKIDKIILLGDIFDFWRRDIKDVVKSYVDDFMTINSKDVIYIRGNHDYIIDAVADGLKIYDSYERGNIIYSHGWKYDILCKGLINVDEYVEISKMLGYTNNEVGGFFSRLWRYYKTIRKIVGYGSGCGIHHFSNVMDFTSNLGMIYGKKLIFGHFHLESVRMWSLSFGALCNGVYYLVDNDKKVAYSFKYNCDKYDVLLI